MLSQKTTPSEFAQKCVNLFPKEEIQEAVNSIDFPKYQNDPVGFGEQVLGETFTDDVKKLMESVRDNPITLAKSANAVGKTHAAARVSVWWYKCFPDSQIFTGAAPPESNLNDFLAQKQTAR